MLKSYTLTLIVMQDSPMAYLLHQQMLVRNKYIYNVYNYYNKSIELSQSIVSAISLCPLICPCAKVCTLSSKMYLLVSNAVSATLVWWYD